MKNQEVIEDVKDNWSTSELWRDDENKRKYITLQCKINSSVFKYIYDDGQVKYSDINRIICRDIHSGWTYTNRYIRNLIDKKFPIYFPYKPGDEITVYCEDFLLNKENGDFDTVGIYYAILPDGQKYEINHFIHYPKNVDNPVVITKELYDEYKNQIKDIC